MYDNSEKGAKFKGAVWRQAYSARQEQSTALASSDVGCQGWYEVMQPCRFAVYKIVRELDEGKMVFESVDWAGQRPEIIGKFAETTYQLKKWHTEWAHHHQVVPDEALVVVALAITIATQGVGGGVFSSMVSSVTGGTMVATTTGMSMASAALTSICAQTATSFLRHGDIVQTGRELFSDRGLRSLGTAIATAGLIGDGGSMASLNFTQRLAVNGFRSFVRASVASAIEKRSFGDTLKEAALSTLVDSISGALAKSIGEAAASSKSPLNPVTHKAAHFGVGALAGGLLDRDNPLSGAIRGGVGAMVAEVVAESLVDRNQIKQEVMKELGIEPGMEPGSSYETELYEAAYREKLQPAMNTAKLVVASLMATLGQDPSIAIITSANALENNFAGVVPPPEMGLDPDVADALWDTSVAIKGAVVDAGKDLYNHPDEYVEEAVIGLTPYGDITRKLYLGEVVSNYDLALETGCLLLGTQPVKAGGRVALKSAKKFGGQFAKRLKEAKHLRTGAVNRNAADRATEVLDLAGLTEKGLVGEYRHVRGHHVHAKKAFDGHMNYDPRKGFSISKQLMKLSEIDHTKVTIAQRRLFNDLVRSGRPNTLKEHTRIAVSALMEGGCKSEEFARKVVAESLRNLRNADVRLPTTIPWHSK